MMRQIFGTAFIFIEAAYVFGLIGNAILWCTFFAPVPPPPVRHLPIEEDVAVSSGCVWRGAAFGSQLYACPYPAKSTGGGR